MLDHRAHLRQRPLNRFRQIPQGFRQVFDDAALDRNVPGHLAILKFGPLLRSGIAGITKDIFLLPVQQRRRLGDVGLIGSGVPTIVWTSSGPGHNQLF
jgi:hypothetical protein